MLQGEGGSGANKAKRSKHNKNNKNKMTFLGKCFSLLKIQKQIKQTTRNQIL